MREICTSGSEEGSAGVIQLFYSPCAKRSRTDLAGESPVAEGEPIPPRSESCVIVDNESGEA